MGSTLSQSIWFTADTHFGHGNIIKYCARPFSSPEEMDEGIYNRFTEVLRPGDILYHLGDLAWSSYPKEKFFSRLRHVTTHFILGNHDSGRPSEYVDAGAAWAGDYKGIHIDKHPVALFHYAMRTWNHKGKGGFALYGHSHGTLEPGLDRSMDVGVDTHNFYPWAWEDIRKVLNERNIFSVSTSREFTTGIGAAHPHAISVPATVCVASSDATGDPGELCI